MAQKAHDHFAKQYLAYLLENKGELDVGYEIRGTSLQVDLIFLPTVTPTDFQVLGLLGRMTSRFCFLEVFSSQPSEVTIGECQLKLLLKHHELYNEARREKISPLTKEVPFLWIITTSASETLTNNYHAMLDLPHWCDGIYFFGKAQKVAIVAINQLPTTPDTLWLRLLGKKIIRNQAIDEIFALPNNHPLRNDVLDLIFNYISKIEKNPNPTEEEKEFVMELSPDYVKWREDTLQRGRQEGRLEERRQFVENLLKFQFGGIDETLAQVVEALLKLSPEESSQLILQSEPKELLAKFIH